MASFPPCPSDLAKREKLVDENAYRATAVPSRDPKSMSRTDLELVRLADAEAQRSRDTTKVGAVFVDAGGSVLSVGHNSMPHGVNTDISSRWQRPEKYRYIEHAERAAIYGACRRGISLDGSVAALSWYPCVECARALIQCGVARIVARKPDESDATWGPDFVIARTLLQEAGVPVAYVV